MQKKFKSWDFERSALSTLVVATLLCLGFASTTQVFAQRAGRPPSGRQLEGTPILPSGTRVIPDGTVLIIEMDTKLNSGTAQISDRFIARVSTPVVDASGRTLLPTGAIVEGHVASVKKARWGHRSGELGLSFDYIDVGYGRRLPLRATLISGSNPIDEEGDLKAKSSGKRDVLITSGGAMAGAGVGMLTGASILAGGGAGAAAGLTAVLIMKGKNVDIDPGERFNLELVQPISLVSGYGNYGQQTGGTRTRQIRRPVPLYPRSRTPAPRTGAELGQYDDPNSIRTQWSRVPIYDASAQRDRDGLLRVVVTAETSTTGWRIYTHHELPSRDTLDIRLMGIPPAQYGVKRIDHPSAPAVCVEDRNSAIRRIVIRGLNGARYLTIGQGATSAKIGSASQSAPSNPQTYYPQSTRPRSRPGSSGGSYGDYSPPTTPTGNLSSLATQTANNLDVLRFNYGAVIGLWVQEDGSVVSMKNGTTASQKELFDTLKSLATSARTLAASSSDSYNRQRVGQQLQNQTQTAQQRWDRVRSSGVISPDLDRQWQTASNNLRSLSAAALR
jgi:opacity protein-like surface antigen